MKKNFVLIRIAVSGITLVSSLAVASGAILTTVPMQGGMVMPLVAYDDAAGRLRMTLSPQAVELIPLLASHPGDRFDPAAPWYEALDPAERGLAFSRRYGFVMDVESDPLPVGTQIWIRKVSGSSDLEIYRNMPGLWEPVFGTAGTSNALHWNAQMFHPAFAAPPGTNVYSATFEAYLLDSLSGDELAGSSSEPVEFNWTAVPDGRPFLTIVPGVSVSWPSTAANWQLESAVAIDASEWLPVTNAPTQVDGASTITLEQEGARRFFRMRLTPDEP